MGARNLLSLEERIRARNLFVSLSRLYRFLRRMEELTRGAEMLTTSFDRLSGSKIATHLDHLSRCKTTSDRIGRIDGPTQYLSGMFAAIRSSSVVRVQRTASERRGHTFSNFGGLCPDSQGQNLAVTVLCVPYSLDSGLSSPPTPGGQAGTPITDSHLLRKHQL
jgi:hypothetical protein